MQFGAEVLPYQRIKKLKKENRQKKEMYLFSILYKMSYFTAALLVSRVMFVNLMAPFGIAFLIAVFLNENQKLSVICACGCLVGYLTLYSNVNSLPAYLLILGMITGADYAFRDVKKIKKLSISLALVFIILSCYRLLVLHMVFPMSILNSFFETASIFPLYFIINNSIICLKEVKTRHLFKNEEIISMSITIFLIIAGTWGLSFREISLKNVIALCIILTIGYINGSTTGAACGVAAGIIMGITSNNIIAYVGVYGVCGMLTGVFKECGKWITGLSFLLAFAILKMYSDVGTQFSIRECLLSCFIFYLISKKTFNKLELELDWEKKQDKLRDNYSVKIKEILLSKLDNFSDVLVNMSKVLEKLVDNDKLAMKGKSSALIESLGDRVCSSCNMKFMCWKRENYYTYTAFHELIQNFQEKKNVIPEEIERKCVKRSLLVKNAEEIVNNFIINEMWRKRLSQGRELLAGQINNMAGSISEILDDFDNDINFNSSIENCIRKVLNKNRIKFQDIFCYNNKNGRLVIKLNMNTCGGAQKCIKSILPLINEVTEKCMCVSDTGCDLNLKSQSCSITFEETPRYHVEICAKGNCKEGEKQNGDSYSYSKLEDGTYMTILSDGMGSGPAAKQESGAAVELIQKFLKSGFNKITAINTVNSIMSIKFSEEENFSTMDMSSIDLYNGNIDFIKVGAVASFIKTPQEIVTIKSRTLPMGVLDKVDIDVFRKNVGNGDIIIMLSDGVLDYNNEAVGKEEWMIDFLNNCNCSNPNELCNQILIKAKELSGGKIRDDMTVIVEKIHNLF